MNGPVLFCYDGSEGSRRALGAAAALLERPAPAVVLTVWERASVRLAMAGGFGSYLSNEDEVDSEEERLATEAANQGVALAREGGYEAEPRVHEATEGAANAIIEVANEIDARLIVSGRRGRGPVTSAVLGSVSHAVLAHSGRPVLISPEK